MEVPQTEKSQYKPLFSPNLGKKNTGFSLNEPQAKYTSHGRTTSTTKKLQTNSGVLLIEHVNCPELSKIYDCVLFYNFINSYLLITIQQGDAGRLTSFLIPHSRWLNRLRWIKNEVRMNQNSDFTTHTTNSAPNSSSTGHKSSHNLSSFKLPCYLCHDAWLFLSAAGGREFSELQTRFLPLS